MYLTASEKFNRVFTPEQHNFRTLTVQSDIQLLAKSVPHLCKVSLSNVSTDGPNTSPVNLCGVDLLIPSSHKHVTLGGIMMINERLVGLTVSHAFENNNGNPVTEHSSVVTFYDSSEDDDMDSDPSEDTSLHGEARQDLIGIQLSDNAAGSSSGTRIFPKTTGDGN